MSARSEREVCAAILAALPRVTPVRLRALLVASGSPEQALAAVADGRVASDAIPVDVAAGWRRALDATAGEVREHLARRPTRVLVFDDPDWPLSLDAPSMPAVLLVEGDDYSALHRPRIAVVGTRHPTPQGIADAREVATTLADAGATVVSGLAYGIDAAAHDAALVAGGTTVGVTATGLDLPYPKPNAHLWSRVREHGLILGENPFGTRPEPRLFPIRNRIIAALSSSVVIIEAAVRGGALHTALAAKDMGKHLWAIPGSRRNPVAEGCNRLIADGAQPLLDPIDIAVAVARDPASLASDPTPVRGRARRGAPLSAGATAVHRACGGEPATLDQLVGITGLPVAAVVAAARELQRLGRMQRASGRLWPL